MTTNDPKNPVPGDRVIDASDLTTTDATGNEIMKMIKFRDGCAKALANLMRLTPEELERAGVNEKEVQRARSLIAEHERAEKLLPAVEKLAELVYKTKLVRAHQISLIIGEMTNHVRRRSERNPNGAAILRPFADLLEYQYAPANKAVATKARAVEENAAPNERPPAET